MAGGAVVSLWRYPVKSMMGEELNASDVTDRGVLGDRSLALVDTETGKVVSAKNPKKWPAMFDFRAAFSAPPELGQPLPPVRVTRPDGATVMSDEAGFVESNWVGKELRLGDDVVVEITDHCPRCVMTTLPQGDLPKDSGILRTAARHNGVNVGVYGEVRHAGRVQRGDAATLG